jgi:hypothetical protein
LILIDANSFIYAHFNVSPSHARARDWLDTQLNGTTPVGLAWNTPIAFLRIVTNARVFENPLLIEDAWAQVVAWLECKPVWIPTPTARHAEILGRLLGTRNVIANLVSDAHLAALAIEHGLTLCSTDGDFARFSDLRWVNPLAP